MTTKTLLKIETEKISVSLIKYADFDNDFVVFTRCLQNYDLDDVDDYCSFKSAQARFMQLANSLILTGWVPNIDPSKVYNLSTTFQHL